MRQALGINAGPKKNSLITQGAIVTFFPSELAKWATLSMQSCQSFILVIFLGSGENLSTRGGRVRLNRDIEFLNTSILTNKENKNIERSQRIILSITDCYLGSHFSFDKYRDTARAKINDSTPSELISSPPILSRFHYRLRQ